MRKSCVVCVLMISLLLSACGTGEKGGPQELALTIRSEYLSAQGCAAGLEVVADYGQRVYTYTVDVTVAGDEGVLTVTAPEEISGITVRMSPERSLLEYDGAVLETGPLDQDGLTPVGAVFALLESARSGFIDNCVLEDLGERQTLQVLCRQPELPAGQGREATLWFDIETHALVQGEVRVDGYRVILCRFQQFHLT